ncbi:MAG: GDP/UDP-N,N'-diacetylbacillosamine 2-epimerase (hydrolyzing) [Alphaproteobacteria bacterium MarineAlpha2_Bin1]|nr:MAG: GDP/UDP-N,N'-diacetylbacillosamine 2-epimerase (hydrolyzing) [Alphaproteobacteria bacterium MarineAlpha2_Bin1]
MIKNKKNICVFTGTRADYGLLKPVMHEIKNRDQLNLQTLVSGSHLSKKYGMTFKEIENDGFKINSKIKLNLKNDRKIDIAKNMGNAIKLYSKELNKFKPDILVILGDRYEALAAAQASMILNIPIAHIHGGESSEGSIDESIRHAITKISHLHFTCAENYKQRVIQMGEDPKNVYNFGAPGLDNISSLKILSKSDIEEKLNIRLKKKIILLSYHPATLGKKHSIEVLKNIFKAFDKIENKSVLVSKSNADSMGLTINKYLEMCEKENKIILKDSFGQDLYLSLIKISDILVGNSSSGIIEAPSMGTPTLNIGPRQNGRLKATSIIDSSEEYLDISEALETALSFNFKQKAKHTINPYGSPGASKKIVEKLASINSSDIIIKSFNQNYNYFS